MRAHVHITSLVALLTAVAACAPSEEECKRLAAHIKYLTGIDSLERESCRNASSKTVDCLLQGGRSDLLTCPGASSLAWDRDSWRRWHCFRVVSQQGTTNSECSQVLPSCQGNREDELYRGTAAEVTRCSPPDSLYVFEYSCVILGEERTCIEGFLSPDECLDARGRWMRSNATKCTRIDADGKPLPTANPDDSRALTEREVQALNAVRRLAKETREAKSQQEEAQQKAEPNRWRDLAQWRRLKRGMSSDEVRVLLGEPGKVSVLGTTTFWYWDYPAGPYVTYDNDRVTGWDEPML